MRSIKATIISISDLVGEFNKHYTWPDFNYLIFGNRYAEGIRYFYFGNDIEYDTEFSKNLCEFLSEEFPNMESIYIDTES